MDKFKGRSCARVIESGRVGQVVNIWKDTVTLQFYSGLGDFLEKERFEACELDPVMAPVVRTSQLGPFVRGEITLADLTEGTGIFGEELKVDSEPYRITAKDFLAGLRVYEGKTEHEKYCWLNTLLEDFYDFVSFCDYDRKLIREKVTEQDLIKYAGDCANDIVWVLEEEFEDRNVEEEWRKLMEILENWIVSDGKDYPDHIRWRVARQFDDNNIDRESKATQELFKECLDYLCDVKKEPGCIRKRGYCYYCGTDIYPNDWVKARDAFIEYYNLTGDASAANTLGYIYYYGRCNNGVPQYEEAFKYFSIGHAYSFFESTYKLADMLSHGYGVVRDVESANHLYWSVYEENVKRFMKGDTRGKFADAALRIGNCYRDGIGEPESSRMAYHYYLQADLAIRERIRVADYYGDNSVFTGIQNAIKEVRQEYTERSRTRKFWGTEWTDWVLIGHRRCRATVKELQNGVLSIFFSPMKRYDEEHAPMMLITVEEADYCELKKKVNIKTAPGSRFVSESGNTEFVFDHVYYDSEKKRTRFFLFEELVCEVYTDGYSFTAPPKEKTEKTGSVYHIVSVKFSEKGRAFDYLCDDVTVKAGDTVVVNGYNGETPVTVVEVSDRYESELGLPVERYKKILRKLRRG